MKKKMLLGMVAAALLAGPLTAAQAVPVLTIDASGHLTGATGVVVGSNTYNVTFQAGTCQSLFNGCVQSAFDFTTREEVLDAAAALLNTVLLDSALGAFDTHPELINGCSNAVFCFVFMPFEVAGPTDVLAGDAQNFADETRDSPGCCGLTFNELFFTYADWELATPVPEPGTLALLCLSLAGLGLIRRRRAA